MTSALALSSIIPSQEAIDAMGRRRHQTCPVKRTKTVGGKNDQWYIRFRIDVQTSPGVFEYIEPPGRSPKYLGYCREMGKREAEGIRDEFLRLINSPGVVIPSQIEFGKVLEEYLDTAQVRDTTRMHYASFIRVHLAEQWSKVRMCDITPRAVERWMQKKALTSTPKTLQLIRVIMGGAWTAALRWGYTSAANPMELMPRMTPGIRTPDRGGLPSSEAVQRFVQALAEPWRLAAQIGLGTGLRISEIRGLRWSDFAGDSLRVEWTVDQQGVRDRLTKTKKSQRSIPIEHLRGLVNRPVDAKPDDFIFPASYWECNHEFLRAEKRTGVRIRIHDLRRLHNTAFRRLSDAPLAMEQLGHTSERTNDIYVIEGAPEFQRRAQVAEKVAEILMGSVTGRIQ